MIRGRRHEQVRRGKATLRKKTSNEDDDGDIVDDKHTVNMEM